jgi:hypothetical protein
MQYYNIASTAFISCLSTIALVSVAMMQCDTVVQ